jgi:TonB-linked SusC/RagA family outer membrane protein
MGMGVAEEPVNGRGRIDVVLYEESTMLEEVVAIGYGVQKKKLNTGATAQVKGDALAKQSTSNALQALQGATSGVQITSTSGQPGKGFNVKIRGAGSIYGTNPLYIVDGVITGDINHLNNADIESIDILKDAASAAIYGAQASNGVVLITTRGGVKGSSAKVSFDGYYGVQNVANMVQQLNAADYAMLMNEQNINSGNPPLYSATGKADFLAKYADTHWIDEIIVPNAPIYDYNVGVAGGTETSVYSISGSITGQDGVVGGHDVSSYQRTNFRINTEHKLYGDFLTVGQHLTYAYEKRTGVGEGDQYSGSPIRAALTTSPFLPMYDDEGNYLDNINSTIYQGAAWTPWAEGEANPYAAMRMTERHATSQKLLGDVYAELQPVKNLKLKTLFGVEPFTSGERSFTPVYHLSMYSYKNNDEATQNLSRGLAWSWDNTLSYEYAFGEHLISALVGTSAREYQGEWMYTGNADLIIPDYEHAWINNTTNTSASNLWSFQGAPNDESKMMSYFGRLGYNYKEKYMLNATFRADGSSRFAPSNRWGYFPSASAGWVVSEENFMSSVQQVMPFLKLRASWGQVGNQNIGAWQYLATIATNDTYYYFGQGLAPGVLTAPGDAINTNGAYPAQLGNSTLRWETSEQTNIGFDARFLNSRLSVNFDWYNKITKDWLISAPVLATTGNSETFINGGDVTNRGVELALQWNDRAGDFNYTVGGNFSYNSNNVGNIPTEDGIIHGRSNQVYNNATAAYRLAQQGYPIGYFWGYETAGILQNQQEVDAYVASLDGKAANSLQGTKITAGDVRFVDRNNDHKITEADKTNIGDPNPDFTFGLSLACAWRGFDLSLTGYGVAGNQLFQAYRDYGSKTDNFTNAIMGRWHGEGTSTKLPRLTESNINYQISDLFVQDGSFFRISNIQLGYDFSKLIGYKYLSQLRLYVAVQNVFTFTAYDGMDPEVGYGTQGANGESYSTSGMDLGYYPRTRVVLAGVNIKF